MIVGGKGDGQGLEREGMGNTIVACWTRPVSRRVNAQDSFSDAM
jgi:hypothetical protein